MFLYVYWWIKNKNPQMLDNVKNPLILGNVDGLKKKILRF